MLEHARTRSLLHIVHGIHTAVILGVMPLIGLICAMYATVAYGATTSVTLGVGDTSILVEGKSSPNSFITILDGTSVVGTTVTNSSGIFSKKLTAARPGVHQLHVYARDTQNRLTDSIQIDLSATEHFQTDVYVFLPPTLGANGPIINPGSPIVYSGSTYPNAAVTLFFNDTDDYHVQANAQGSWTYSVDTTELDLGTYEAVVRATDEASGEQSYTSRKLAITIAEPVPEPETPPATPGSSPTPGTPSKPPVKTVPRTPTITPPQNDVVTESPFTIQGTGQPRTQIEVFNGGRPIGSTIVDRSGSWSLTISLQDIEYYLRARSCTTGGCSGFSNTVHLFYQPGTNGQLFAAWLDQYAFTAPTDQTVTLRAHTHRGQQPFNAQIDWGDTTHEQSTHAERNFELRHIYQAAGQYKGTVTITDTASKTVVIMFSALITETATVRTFMWPLALLVIFVLLSIGIIGYLYWRRHRHPQP